MPDEAPAAPEEVKVYAVLGHPKSGKPETLGINLPLAEARAKFNEALKLADKFEVIELRGRAEDESFRQKTSKPGTGNPEPKNES